LLREKLRELHGIALGKETIRRILVRNGIWLPRDQRVAKPHQPRFRRECLGELVQIDGCEHYWFEDRGPYCSLLVYVDDATGRLMEMLFVSTESTFGYFEATAGYLRRHGKPVAFYSDKHSVFRVTREGSSGVHRGITQFARALAELNIDIICANTPQNRGEAASLLIEDHRRRSAGFRGHHRWDPGGRRGQRVATDGRLLRSPTPRADRGRSGSAEAARCSDACARDRGRDGSQAATAALPDASPPEHSLEAAGAALPTSTPAPAARPSDSPGNSHLVHGRIPHRRNRSSAGVECGCSAPTFCWGYWSGSRQGTGVFLGQTRRAGTASKGCAVGVA
jgi:hypothetical protein